MKRRKFLLKLGLSLGSLVLTLLVGEVVARVAEPGPMSLVDRRPYQPDEGLSYVHIPGFKGRWDSTWYDINSRGWRGPEVVPTGAADELRVVCLGDSCTFGKAVLEKDSWPRQLEALLNRELGPSRHAVVFNLGVNGYSLWQYERALREQALALDPDWIIVGYNVNDYDSAAFRADGAVFGGISLEGKKGAAPKPRPQAGSVNSGRAGGAGLGPPALQVAEPQKPLPAGANARVAPSFRSRLRAWLPDSLRDSFNQSALYRFARATYYDWTRERDYQQMARIVHELSSQAVVDREKTLVQETETMGKLVASAESCGARVAIFLFPFEAMIYVDDFDRGPESFVTELASRSRITFVDMPNAFRDSLRDEAAAKNKARLFVRGDRYHPNARGYGIVARTLLERLREQGWLAQEPRAPQTGK